LPKRLAIPAAAAWLALLALALALSVLAASHDHLAGDTGISHWAQDLPFPGTPLADFVRRITETEVVIATGFTIVLILWLRGYQRQAVVLAGALLLLGALAVLVKAAVDRPRPDPSLVIRRAGFDGSSFPSGHVLSATVLYGFMLYLAATLALPALPRITLAAVSAFFLTMVGPASVYLGVHWPSDVLGGWAWALLILSLAIGADRFLALKY